MSHSNRGICGVDGLGPFSYDVGVPLPVDVTTCNEPIVEEYMLYVDGLW